MSNNTQWMTFENPKMDWQHNNHVTIFAENNIVTGCQPPLLSIVYNEISLTLAYKLALESGLTLISYSLWNITYRNFRVVPSILNKNTKRSLK